MDGLKPSHGKAARDQQVQESGGVVTADDGQGQPEQQPAEQVVEQEAVETPAQNQQQDSAETTNAANDQKVSESNGQVAEGVLT